MKTLGTTTAISVGIVAQGSLGDVKNAKDLLFAAAIGVGGGLLGYAGAKLRPKVAAHLGPPILSAAERVGPYVGPPIRNTAAKLDQFMGSPVRRVKTRMDEFIERRLQEQEAEAHQEP
jgi:hypothetical protein